MSRTFCLPAALSLLLIASTSALADNKNNAEEGKALKGRAEAFIAAFNKGEAAALADFWLPDGDYVDQAGHALSGREAIAAAFEKQFAVAKGAKLVIRTGSLRFMNGDVAIEDGTTEIVYPNGIPPTGARYTAVHVKKEGQWYLASVRDAILVPSSNHEHLRGLGWLAGEWLDESEKGEVLKTSYSWAENDNFLVSSFVTTLKDVPVSGGTQWIGWDSAAKKIRSWSFGSNGSFSEGAWSCDGDKWSVQVKATLPDGKKMSATVRIAKVDDDHLAWQSTNRSVGGEAVADSQVIKMKRVR